jgi:hypothetical protein
VWGEWGVVREKYYKKISEKHEGEDEGERK